MVPYYDGDFGGYGVPQNYGGGYGGMGGYAAMMQPRQMGGYMGMMQPRTPYYTDGYGGYGGGVGDYGGMLGYQQQMRGYQQTPYPPQYPRTLSPSVMSGYESMRGFSTPPGLQQQNRSLAPNRLGSQTTQTQPPTVSTGLQQRAQQAPQNAPDVQQLRGFSTPPGSQQQNRSLAPNRLGSQVAQTQPATFPSQQMAQQAMQSAARYRDFGQYGVPGYGFGRQNMQSQAPNYFGGFGGLGDLGSRFADFRRYMA